MTQHVSSTAADGESQVFTPTADFVVQTQVEIDSRAVIEIHGRVDTLAPWAIIVGAYAANESFLRSPKLAQAKIVWHGNTGGKLINVWSDAG